MQKRFKNFDRIKLVILEHQKRIHLFGLASEIERLGDIQAACIGFNIMVTEEVCND